MSVWDWISEFESKAYASNDPERQQLVEYYYIAQEFHDYDHDRALALLQQGREFARRLGEPWWVLFYEHWRIQVLLFHKRDYTAALDAAVRAAVEVRKPIYAHLPQRICLHEDVISAYAGIDPAGHATKIQQALDYMESEITPDLE